MLRLKLDKPHAFKKGEILVLEITEVTMPSIPSPGRWTIQANLLSAESDIDAGLKIRPEIVDRLQKAQQRPKDELLTLEEMRGKNAETN